MPQLAFIGFGEAAQGLLSEMVSTDGVRVFDPKLLGAETHAESPDQDQYPDYRICRSVDEAALEAEAVFCLVTAGRAVSAAESVGGFRRSPLYFDCNSCSPDTKRQAADIIHGKGGRYVDVAIMAPVGNTGPTPLLASGPHATKAVGFLQTAGLGNAREISGGIGSAAALKLARSIVVKGQQALLIEAMLAAESLGLASELADSLSETWPSIDWERQTEYIIERMTKHGPRRQEEMKEAAAMLQSWGLPGGMTEAAKEMEQRIAGLELDKSSGREAGLEGLLGGLVTQAKESK